MRNVPIDLVDGLDSAVLAIATDYPPGHVLPRHRHRRAQLLYGATGTMQVDTADGSWTIPPQRAVLIPPQTDHEVRMHGVSTRSLYLEPVAVPWFPVSCQVVAVSPLLRELLIAAVDLPVERTPHGRESALVTLLLHEIEAVSPLPFGLPMPADEALRARCEAFAASPGIGVAPHEWAMGLGVSTRTFVRHFKTQTGLTFQQWRQRACLVHAIRLLTSGHSVTHTAAALGYSSPAAFTAMFVKNAGSTPDALRRGR